MNNSALLTRRDSTTIGAALRRGRARLGAAGIDDAALESELLLRHALGLSREELLARLREPLGDRTRATFDTLLERRLAHEPTPYITGRCEFYGRELKCSPAALIPRPETEMLVDLGLTDVRHGSRMVDVGTGNGAIAISIAANAPDVEALATDRSREALDLARENARAHGVGKRITFVQSDLLPSVRGPFDVIVANLPYVPLALRETLAPEIREYEPGSALFAGEHGAEVIERLLDQARDALAPHGLLLAEHAWDQGKRARAAAAAAFPNAHIETKRDPAGLERVLVVRRTGGTCFGRHTVVGQRLEPRV